MKPEQNPVFATTRWTQIIEAAHSGDPRSGEALAEVCRVYWYPLYAYVRRQGFDEHTAGDLTQEFFSKFLEKNYLDVADRRRGRFRWFLLTAFKCFLANEWDRANAKKRGGGEKPLSLDAMTAEQRYRAEPVNNMSPDQLYDRRWALELLQRTHAALADDYARNDRANRFELLHVFLPGGQPTTSQANLGERLGLSENAVKQEVHRMKKRFGELLRAEIRATVSHSDEVDDELRYLIDIVCRS